jgi:hypothetical protein
MKAINEINKMFKKPAYFNENDLKIVHDLLEPKNVNFSTESAFTNMTMIQGKFAGHGFNILNESEEILKTLKFRIKFERVFKMILDKKIDSKTIVNDLKEYINDIENSILKI